MHKDVLRGVIVMDVLFAKFIASFLKLRLYVVICPVH